jgi:hypothetical protein
MALVLADRVKETTNTIGTGTLTLAGAATGFQGFAAIGNGNTTFYAITSGAAWEVGLGTYSAPATTLSRDTIYSSSAGGARITVAAGASVYCTYPAGRSISRNIGLFDTAFAGINTGGVIVDYVSPSGRISVGAAQGIKFFNNGAGVTLLGEALSNGNWDFNGNISAGTGTAISGIATPLIAAAGNADNSVQTLTHNNSIGLSASAGFAAYPDNGTSTSGNIAFGVTSSRYANATYAVTGENEGYVLMSAPSGAAKTGNLVFATDATGTENSYQWYVGGFTQAKTAYKMLLNGTNLYVKQPIKADGIVESTTGGFTFPDATTQTSAFIAANGLLNMPNAWVKAAARAATTANITLSGLQTVDGVALIAGDRCLVKNQTAEQDNGIYDVSATTWTRSSDANLIGELAGALVTITEGTQFGGKAFDTDLKATDTLGTTVMRWYALVDTNGATFGGTLSLRAGTTAVGTAPMYLTAGTNLTTAAAGAVEFDTANTLLTFTGNTTNGRGIVPNTHYFRLPTDGAATTTTIAPFFGAASAIPLVANSVYEIDIEVHFSKNTAGSLVWTFTNSTTIANMAVNMQMSATAGATAIAAALSASITSVSNAAVAFPSTGVLSNAVKHWARFKVILESGASTSVRLNVTNSAGTLTPLRGSFWKATRIANIGTYAV